MMTVAEAEQKTRTVEEIRDEVNRARAGLAELRREEAGIASRLKTSAAEDQGALAEAALSGSLKMKTPRLDKARQRAGELPYLLWAGELRLLQLQEELAELQRAEIEEQLPTLHRAVQEKEKAAKAAQEEYLAARNEHASLVEERRDITRGQH